MKPLSLTFAQNTCKRNRKSAGQKYSARRLCRSFVALMLSQSCTLVKREKTYFVHICKKCCAISPKSTCKIVHHVGGRAYPARSLPPYPFCDSIRRGGIHPSRAPSRRRKPPRRPEGWPPYTPTSNPCVGRGALTPPKPAAPYMHHPYISLNLFIFLQKNLPKNFSLCYNIIK